MPGKLQHPAEVVSPGKRGPHVLIEFRLTGRKLEGGSGSAAQGLLLGQKAPSGEETPTAPIAAPIVGTALPKTRRWGLSSQLQSR